MVSLAGLALDLHTDMRDLGGGTGDPQRTLAVRKQEKQQSTQPRVENTASH